MTADAKHHLLITGTGRAGTSFLVRLLDAIGLETHFSRFGEYAAWDDHANAGAENLPIPALDAAMPYVVKSPWAGEFIDRILSDQAMILDAVIIPMRDIDDAASSRVIVELRDSIEHDGVATELDAPFAHRGKTGGGVVYSLHPLDQKRILSVGFHHLVERLTAAEVPILFLHFPRLVHDADYLYDRLAPVLRMPVDRDGFLAAHARIARLDQVRVNAVSRDTEIDRLERVALVRELERLRGCLSDAARESAELREHLAASAREVAALREHARLIEASTMWRATAPLRRVLHRMRRR